MNLKDLKLTKDEIRQIEAWRNGYGRLLWKEELLRYWRGERCALDTLYEHGDGSLLMGLKDKIGPHLMKLSVGYSGPDRD